MPTLRTGPRGGKYYIKNGRRIYVTKSSKRKTSKRKTSKRKTSKRKTSKRKSSKRKECKPGKKKFAKMVNGKCVRFGDRSMTIKKNIPARKRSFCARHKCRQKCNRATPGYQSCKKWDCVTCR
jgi:hypothetical protein